MTDRLAMSADNPVIEPRRAERLFIRLLITAALVVRGASVRSAVAEADRLTRELIRAVCRG